MQHLELTHQGWYAIKQRNLKKYLFNDDYYQRILSFTEFIPIL